MKIIIQALSSSGDSYPVEFTDETGVLQVYCHCQAGILQQMCRHKIGLLQGNFKMLFNPTEEPLLKQVLNCQAYAPLKTRLDQYEANLSEIEREMAKLKVKEKSVKQAFAYELTHGKENPNAVKKIWILKS